jgi:hypothetical protein
MTPFPDLAEASRDAWAAMVDRGQVAHPLCAVCPRPARFDLGELRSCAECLPDRVSYLLGISVSVQVRRIS